MNLRRRQQPAPRGQEVAKGVTRPPLVTTQQHTPPPVNPTRTETPEPRSYGEQLRRQAEALQQQVRDLMAANTELWDAIRAKDGRIVGLSGDNYRLTEGNKTLAKRVTALEAEVGQRKETARNLGIAALAVEEKHAAKVEELMRAFADVNGQLMRKCGELEEADLKIARLEEFNGALSARLDVAKQDAEERREELASATARLAGLLDQMDGTGRPESTDPEPTSILPRIVGGQTRTDVSPGQQTWSGALPDFPTPWQTGAWGPRSSGGQSAPLVGES